MKEQDSDKVIRLTIDSRLENVFLVGLAVRGICAPTFPNRADSSKMEVCVVEAVTNAIKHSYHLQPGHDVDIVIALKFEKIEFLVSNTGEPMNTEQTTKIHFDPDGKRELPEGGLGLYLIHSMMDEVIYESNGSVNIIRMCKRYGAGAP